MASLICSPPSSQVSVNTVITVTGTGTSWVGKTASTLFTLSGTGNSVIGADTVINSNTSATITVTAAAVVGLFTLTDTSTSATQWFAVGNFFIASSANIFSSPYSWYQNADGSLTTTSYGAYQKFGFGKTSIQVGLTGGSGTTSHPTILMSTVDAVYPAGGVYEYTAQPAITLASIASGLSTAAHQFRVDMPYLVFTGVDEWTGTPWPGNALTVLGYFLDAGDTISAPSGWNAVRPNNALFYTDSTGQGWNCDRMYATFSPYTPAVSNLANANVNCMHSQLAMWSYAFNCEYGLVSHEGNGYVTGGSCNVPALGSAYNYRWNGLLLPTSGGYLVPTPNYLIDYKGASDYVAGEPIATVQTAAAAVMPLMRALLPLSSTYIKIVPWDAYGGAAYPSAGFASAFTTAFGSLTQVATADDAVMYAAPPAYPNTYLINHGATVSQGGQLGSYPTLTACDAEHADSGMQGRMVALTSKMLGHIQGATQAQAASWNGGWA